MSGFPDMFFDRLSESLIATFILSFLILFIGLLLRRKWLGAVVVWLLLAGVFIASGITTKQPLIEIAMMCVFATAFIFVIARFGVVAFLSFVMTGTIMNLPVTTELSAWYASEFVLYTIVLIGLAIFGFYTSTAGQKLWQGKL